VYFQVLRVVEIFEQRVHFFLELLLAFAVRRPAVQGA